MPRRSQRKDLQGGAPTRSKCHEALKLQMPRGISKGLVALVVVLGVLLSMPQFATASGGDGSEYFLDCVTGCQAENCSTPTLEAAFGKKQPLSERLLMWTCSDECKYTCMWSTVHAFAAAGIKTPQFYGKWPFARIMGLQEPASFLFSLLNLAAHVRGLSLLVRSVPSTAPMFVVWAGYGLVSINTWLWSAVFHARDSDFTERMDYYCAFSVITFSLMAFLLRLLLDSDGVRRRTWLSCAAAAACVYLFMQHVFWLAASQRFDYSYNMAVNVGVGGANAACWFLWSAYQVFTNKYSRTAAFNCSASVVLLTSAVSLELLDFAPVFRWTLDAHALWHLATAPIHGMWYAFVVEDCLILDGKTFKRHLEDRKRV